MNLQGRELKALYKKQDPSTGLRMAIAIHDDTLGPALGGIRFFDYPNEKAWLTDAIRLAEGMTHKNAIIHKLSQGQLSHGGGKAVIWGDPEKDKTRELLLSAADFINSLEGRYIGGEDMNMRTRDMEVMYERTQFITGLQKIRHKDGRIGSGDPSPITALGVFEGIKTCLKFVFGTSSLGGRKFAMSGIGSVGIRVLGYLNAQGAKKIIVADSDEKKINRLRLKFPAPKYPHIRILDVADAEKIYNEECDVLVPCAVGAIINDETIPRLKCKIIAGCANNQLLEPRHGEKLWRRKRRIFYAPDYVINAGGAINVASELAPEGYDPQKAREITRRIGPLLAEILKEAREKDTPPELIADGLVAKILASAKSNI